MDNFKKFGGPGGLKGRKEFIGGRPKSDANYGAKKSFGDKKPSFGGGKPSFGGRDGGGSRGGDRGGRGGFDRGGDRGGDRRPVEMHKATCSTCGKGCEVPFRPDGSKPVLCSECFGKNKSDDRNGNERRTSFESRDRSFGNDRPKRDFESRPPRQGGPDYAVLVKQVASLETKINDILSLLAKKETKKEVKEVKEVVSKDTPEADAPKKERKPKKTTVAKKVAKKIAAKKVAKKAVKKVK